MFVIHVHLCLQFQFLHLITSTFSLWKKKKLVILFFECVVEEMVMFYAFSFPPVVYVGTLNLIASIPDPSILTLNLTTWVTGCLQVVAEIPANV